MFLRIWVFRPNNDIITIMLLFNCRDPMRFAEIVRNSYGEGANERVSCSSLPNVDHHAWAQRPPPRYMHGAHGGREAVS